MSANQQYEFPVDNPSVTGGTLPMEVEVVEGLLQPDDIWSEKDGVLEHEAKSMEEWAQMSEDDRETTLQIVTNALDRLIEVAPEWVPACMRVVPGEYLNLNFRILFADVDSEMRNAKVVTQRRIDAAAAGAVDLLKEDFETPPADLEPDDPEVAAEG